MLFVENNKSPASSIDEWTDDGWTMLDNALILLFIAHTNKIK